MANEKRLIDANELESRLVCESEFRKRNMNCFGALVIDEIIANELANSPTVDAVEVVHAYWTGLTPSDYTFAEGFSNEMTPEERAKGHEDFIHTTHCSNCNGGFDDRWIRCWRYCPYCGAKMDGGNDDG